MGIRRIGLVIAMMASISACSEHRIDSSSEEAFKASIGKVKADLKGEEVNQFDQALQVVMFKNLSMSTFASALTDKTAPERFLASAKSEVDGKTGKEVIKQAEQINNERKAKEREQALAEIEELLARKNSASQDAANLALFTVSKSRFRQVEERYSSYLKPVIDLTVRNGTTQAVSRAYFEAVLASPNRAVPWLKEDFNYEISGGLEPGESASWSLAPNQFGPWGKVDAPADAVLTVKAVKLDGADGKPFLSSSFSEADEKRLTTLTARYASTSAK